MHWPTVVVSMLAIHTFGDATARAEPPSGSADAPAVRWALGVNVPIAWLSGSFGASLALGWGEHQAIRANVAYYDQSPVIADVIVVLAGGDDEARQEGGTTDLGIGWIYFPRRQWSGASFEVGLLGRFRDTESEDDFAEMEFTATDTTTIAGRGLIGWSWRLGRHVYIATAVGLSVGRESGRESTQTFDPEPVIRQDVERTTTMFEGYLRLGVASFP